MNGIRIAAPTKDLLKAQYKDENLDTRLITLPVVDVKPFKVVFEAGVLYGFGGAELPMGVVEHGLPRAPLFRGWVNDVDTTTGQPSGKRYSIPYVAAGLFFYIRSNNKTLNIYPSFTGATFTPPVRLEYAGVVYIFGSKI